MDRENEEGKRTEDTRSAQDIQPDQIAQDMQTAQDMPNTRSAVQEGENAQPAQSHAAAAVMPTAASRSNSSFAERMGDAGYIAGRRYDAVKNAFLAYKTKDRRPKTVRSRITRSGETFYAGRKVLGKVCLVGGYLRLFLALDPKQYNVDKYHHKDYSEVVRYAKFPFMIKLSSDRQEKYAVELIDELLVLNGFVRDESYEEKDQANIFKKTRRKKAEPQAAEVRTVYVPVPAEAEAAAAEDIGEPESIDVKLPKRGTVLDKQGKRIGKVRKSVWRDEEETEQGVFVKEETNVFVYAGETRTGYVDKNDNILTLSNKYVATIRRAERFWILALVIFLVLVTLLTVILSAYFLTRSENSDYAPVLFIASEDGTDWNDAEELPVFFNETFGDSKIAPGMKGSYRFTFENRNKNALEYSLQFSEENEYGISIVYRLKRDGAYISGAQDYVGAAQLGLEQLTVEASSSTVFELEWYWQDNDAADTVAGENSAVYSLTITLSAHIAGQE